MNRAPVSVVIPSYNCGRFLPDALDSILSQTMVPAQVVVVDDGSNDDTAERVAPYLGRVEYVVQSNAGPSAARNRGLRAAGERIVAFLDADDVWHPAKVEFQMRVMTELPQLQMLGTDTFDWPAPSFPGADPAGAARVIELTWEAMVVRTTLLTSSLFVRRKAAERAGEFDLSLRGPEDRDWFLRIARDGAVGLLDVPLTGYRAVPGSISRQAERCEMGMRQILSKLDASDAWVGQARRLRAKAYGYLWYSSALNYAAAGDHARAAWRLARSVATYPMPYSRSDVPVRLGRLKSLAVQILRCARLKAPVPTPRPSLDDHRLDALEPLRERLRGRSLA